MKRILVFYTYFSPAYKAGGPVQSLTNLTLHLKENLAFYVVCGAYDLGETTILKDIKTDQWTTFCQNIEVCYLTDTGVNKFKDIISEVNADVIYINGMFTPSFSLAPLWLGKKLAKRIVLSPRGMLQQGALNVKPLKKKIFLTLFKLFGLHSGIVWHATDKQEKEDIHRLFGQTADVRIASNIPKALAKRSTIVKEKGTLRIVYLSLISEKKNLHVILQALQRVSSHIEFDIYGPIKDDKYWQECAPMMKSSHHSIRYLGPVKPDAVQGILSRYHALVLPTKGENFGHAIFEAFSCGTPAIISNFTPWGRLQDVNAGLTVNTEDPVQWKQAIETFLALDQVAFDTLSQGSYQVAVNYLADKDFVKQYSILFE